MLSQIAQRSGRAPSDVAEIDCAFCAYCFDETLLFLEAKALEADMRERDNKERMTRLRSMVGLN